MVARRMHSLGRRRGRHVVVHLHRSSIGGPSGLENPDDRTSFVLEPGQIAGLSGLPGSGLTRVGLSLLQPYATRGHLAYLDVRGWANPEAAWEMGIRPERLIVVRPERAIELFREVLDKAPPDTEIHVAARKQLAALVR